MANPTSFTVSLRYVTRSLYVSIFPVLSTVVAPWLLARVPQGRELLDMVADEQILGFWKHWTTLLHYILFLCALLAWGFASWYGSRVLLQHDFRNPLPSGTRGHRFINAWNEWQPRVLGVLGMAAIAGYILFYRMQLWAGGIAAAVVVLFALFIIHRRRIFKLPSAAAASRNVLLKGDRIAIWLGLACSFVIFVALAKVNYSFARTLGAPVILFTALASIVLASSVVLAYLPLSYGWPNLAWTPFVLAFVLASTPLTRNHGVTPRLIESEDRSGGSRPSVVEDFRAWTRIRRAGRPGWPIYIVAAEGGASRSAWWTAHVLATLDYASDGEFSRHVYAISGVSGGSLGAAAFVGLLAERGDSKPAFSKPLAFPDLGHCWDMRQNRDEYPTPAQAECFLGEDFLSPTLGYMLYPDLLQRIVPVPINSWDRSLGLEQTWQNDWAHLFGARQVSEDPPLAVGKFGETLDALYQSAEWRTDVPLLFLNTTRAGTGRSALQSPVSIPSTELDDVFDHRLRTRGLPLATVVHNSARFPLVSPGGEVETRNGDYWDALVDGGYFENSGAATLAELIRALQAPPKQDETRLDAELANVHVIFIMNDPAGGTPLFEPPPHRDAPLPLEERIGHEELMTPLLGLYNTRTARADSSKRELMSLLPDGAHKLTEIFLSRGIEASRKVKGREKDPDPSMSWHMNPSSRRAMWAAVGEKSTHDALCDLLESVGSDCSRLEELRMIPPESNR